MSGADAILQIPFDPDDRGHEFDGGFVVQVLTEASIPLSGSDVWLEGATQRLEPYPVSDYFSMFSGPPGLYALHVEYPGFNPVQKPVELISRRQSPTFETIDITIVRGLR